MLMPHVLLLFLVRGTSCLFPLPRCLQRRAVATGLGLSLGFGLVAGPTPLARAQTPKLSIESIEGDEARLVCDTPSDDPMTLEASFSLEAWFVVDSATPTNRVARFRHAWPRQPGGIFYRARVGLAPESPRVVPELDSMQTDAGLLTAEDGIRLELRTPQGVRFEFSAGTNLVAEPMPIRMTLITNFASFPSAGGWQAAVAFEPEGFRFRRNASLRITFPTNVPSADLLAYSFEGNGEGFHLRAFESSTNAVVLAVDGFSGKGVGYFPVELPSTLSEPYRQAADASRAAEDRAARRESRIAKDRDRGLITEQQAEDRRRASRLRKLEEVYRTSIRPFESGARSSCDVAKSLVVLDLEKLATEWSETTGHPASESPFTPVMVDLAAAMRCRCGQELVDRCEKEAGVSGSALVDQLTEILNDAARITGRSDAHGCALGTDTEILERLRAGPCFGEWSGSIVLTQNTSMSGVHYEGVIEQNWDNETQETYVGKVTGVASQRTFTVGGRRVQTWRLTTAGPYAASRKVLERLVRDDPKSDVIERRTIRSTATAAPKAAGTIELRLVDGLFDSVVASGRPIRSEDTQLDYTTLDDTEYECRETFPKDRECPSGRLNVSDFSMNLYMGVGVDTNTVPDPVVTVSQRGLVLTWARWDRQESDLPGWPPSFRNDRIVVNLLRK